MLSLDGLVSPKRSLSRGRISAHFVAFVGEMKEKVRQTRELLSRRFCLLACLLAGVLYQQVPTCYIRFSWGTILSPRNVAAVLLVRSVLLFFFFSPQRVKGNSWWNQIATPPTATANAGADEQDYWSAQDLDAGGGAGSGGVVDTLPMGPVLEGYVCHQPSNTRVSFILFRIEQDLILHSGG